MRTLLAPSDRSKARQSILSSRRAGRRDVWTEPHVQHVQRQKQQIRLSGEANSKFLLIRLPIGFVTSRLDLAPLRPHSFRHSLHSTSHFASRSRAIHHARCVHHLHHSSFHCPASASTPPIPPPRFRERDETEVRPLDAGLYLLDLQRATATQVRRFRHVPMDSWLLAQRDPAAALLFSTRTHESFFRAQLSAQISLRAHRLLDVPAFLSATGTESEAHLSYLLGLLSLLTFGGRYIEEWVRVFFATVWIDHDHKWLRFCFEHEDVTLHATQIRELFGFPQSMTRLHNL
jgi:hypothetical protein